MTGKFRSPLKRFATLAESDQAQVKEAAEVVLKVWPRPVMAPEQRLLFVDDLAVLYREFGADVLETAIDWLRQNEDRRPSVKVIRDACAAQRSRMKYTPNPKLNELEQLHSEREKSPEKFMPAALIYRDTWDLARMKVQRKKEGRPMSHAEIATVMRDQDQKRQEEWATAISTGKHLDSPKRKISEVGA